MLPAALFEQLVAEAVDDLPPFFQERMENVELLVRPWPTRADLDQVGLPAGFTRLGLYHGIP